MLEHSKRDKCVNARAKQSGPATDLLDATAGKRRFDPLGIVA